MLGFPELMDSRHMKVVKLSALSVVTYGEGSPIIDGVYVVKLSYYYKMEQ
jgi:hypothetical protein